MSDRWPRKVRKARKARKARKQEKKEILSPIALSYSQNQKGQNMAETAAGIHINDQESEWSRFDFRQPQQEYQPSDSDFHPSNLLPQYHQHNPLDFAPATHGVLYDKQGQALLPHHYGNDFDSADTENKIPLTQDQVAVLESSFIAVPKPKTEHKKGLAEKLGLDLRRVNNWFQNRRAKAKCQKTLGHQESDASSTEVPSSNATQSFSLPTSESQVSSTTYLQDQITYSLDPFSHSFTTTSTADFNLLIDSKSGQADTMGLPFDHVSNGDFSLECHDGLTASPAWMTDLHLNSTGQHYVTSVANPEATTSWSPQSPRASHPFAAGFDVGGKDFVNPLIAQNTVMGNGLLDNHSSQTLNSNPSSVAESNNLMTPLTNTPPLPWLSQEFDGRRASDSSELAHNVEGMHLQQSQWGLGLANTTAPPSVGSTVVSATGIATPETSPDQTAVKASVSSSDIASRRKRHRPAALRPETGRSISYGGPMTTSPQSRRSSASLAPPKQVRRIQSQGQSLNTQSFRIHKPATNSAQKSPRNLQKYIERQPLPQAYNHAVEDSNTPTQSTAQAGHGKPSASAASASRSPAEYQHEFHINRPLDNWNTSNIFNMPHANSSVPELHSASSQSHPSPSNQAANQLHTQHPQYNCPPQSAPPHQTRFFDGSPPAQNGPSPPPNWQGHSFAPPAPHIIGDNTIPMRQPARLTQRNNGGYLPPFAPSYQFPPECPPMPGFPATSLFHGFLPCVLSSVPASPVELDIKVDVGPEPKLASRFDKFEFQHTFSDKYGEKK
ncbi:MAG: hypothetical protein Q9217_000983 [Psora testacea]